MVLLNVLFITKKESRGSYLFFKLSKSSFIHLEVSPTFKENYDFYLLDEPWQGNLPFLYLNFGGEIKTDLNKTIFMDKDSDNLGSKILKKYYTLHDEFLNSFLKDLGISPHLRGFFYLRDLIHKEEYFMKSLNDSYKSEAETFKTTREAIERDMRYAINHGFPRGDYNLINDVFQNSLSYDQIPSNKQFLLAVINYLF